MSATNIVVARFGTSKNTQTRNLWQYDYGQILQFVGLDLPAAYIVHFSNSQFSGEAKTMIGNEDGVDIPDEYLETGSTVYAWIYLHAGEDDGETVYMVTIPVKARPRPTEDEPTPVQQGAIDAAIAALNSGVAEVQETVADIQQTIDDALQEAKDSGEFDGYTPVKGVDYFDGYTPIKGVDYFDGEPGYTPVKGVDYFDGYTPIKGVDYFDGEPGYTPIKGVDYFDGKDGHTPVKGVDYFDGEDGATFTPSVSEQGIISWTNDKGLPNPESRDIRGPRGEPGSGVSIHICSSSEYDAVTRVPTVQNPDTNTFYLVPAEDAASPDMFVEWIFTNNAWEMFGSATVEVPVQSVNGKTGTVVLNAQDVGAYAKPSTGIPKTDLESSVQTSLDKADTALQSAPVTSVNSKTGAVVLDAADVGAYSKPAGGIPASDLATGVIPDVPVQDVQVNGVSVLQDGVANVPTANSQRYGAVRVGSGLYHDNGLIYVDASSDALIKSGDNVYRAIVPARQHRSTFYGLAKAAGSDEKNSTLPVGQYTESAKSAISQMLSGSVFVSGTTPTITALPGIRYVCGEVATLDITLPASGIVDVVFESGSTATVLTVTPPTGTTIKWANGFDPTALEADTTYEINIADGLGVAASWT